MKTIRRGGGGSPPAAVMGSILRADKWTRTSLNYVVVRHKGRWRRFDATGIPATTMDKRYCSRDLEPCRVAL